MAKNKFLIRVSVLAALLLLISACNDSGRPDSFASIPAAPVIAPPPVTISGSAVKGIIKGGIVSIFGITDGQKDSEPLVTGTTDSSGQYSLEIPGDYSGPVIIEITASAMTLSGIL